MKILILHQHYKDPAKGGAIRSYYLATALVNAGHQVTVLSAHAQGGQQFLHPEGFEVVMLAVPYKNEFTFWKRSVAFLRFAFAIVRQGGRFRGYDLCYAISTPLTIGLPAWWLKIRYGIPFLFEVGDLWPEVPIQLGFIKSPLLQMVLRAFEKQMYHQARAIVALSPAIQTAVQIRAPRRTVHFIPNMADTDFYRPEEKLPETERKFGVEKRFVVSYLGALGYANGLDFLLECANACRKAGAPVHFLVGGEGAHASRLRDTAKRMQLPNVSFLGMLTRDQVREVLAVTDAVLISYRSEPILETGSPNKYFDGLAAGKLVIINFSGWIRSEIEREQCGLWVNPQQPSEFVRKLEIFWQQPAQLKTHKACARNLALSAYARTILSQKFGAIISRC